MKKIITYTLLTLFLISCSTVPITGRKRVNFVSDAQILPVAFAQYSGFLQQNKLSADAAKTLEIKTVGKRISSAVDRFMRANGMESEADSYKWEFNLVEDKLVNAWCMPGGKVVFYTGILPICKNTDGIAAVMGHEVAHAFAKHGQERMSTGQMQQIGGVAVAVATANNPKKAQIWNTVYGIGTQVGIMLPFSRTHEREADRLGLVFMLMAGYDGREAAQVWVRMSQRPGAENAPPQFMSTHPSNQSRIADLNGYLAEARVLAKKYNAKNFSK